MYCIFDGYTSASCRIGDVHAFEILAIVGAAVDAIDAAVGAVGTPWSLVRPFTSQ